MTEYRDNDQREVLPSAKDDARFDWDIDLDALSSEDAMTSTPEEMSRLNETVGMIFNWALEPLRGRGPYSQQQLQLIGRRMVALAWVMHPSWFGDDPSGTSVGRSIGCHKAVFSELTAEVSRRFGLRNRHQLHGGNFKEEKNNEHKNNCQKEI